MGDIQQPFSIERIVVGLNLTDTPRGKALKRRWIRELADGIGREIYMELDARKELRAVQIANHLNRPLAEVMEKLEYLYFIDVLERREYSSDFLYRLRRGMPEQDHSDNLSAALYRLEPEYYRLAKERLLTGLAHLPGVTTLIDQWIALHAQYANQIFSGQFAPVTIYCSRDFTSWMVLRSDGRSFLVGPYCISDDEWGLQARLDFLAQAERIGLGYSADVWGSVYAQVLPGEEQVYTDFGFELLGPMGSGGQGQLACLPQALDSPSEVIVPLHCCIEEEVVNLVVKQSGRDEVLIRAILNFWLSRTQDCFYFGFQAGGRCRGVVGVSTNGIAERLLPFIAESDVQERFLQAIAFVMSRAGDYSIDLAIRIEAPREAALRQLGWIQSHDDEWRFTR